MQEKLIDGKLVSAHLREKLTKEVKELKASGITPGLVVILVGEDPASQVYVRNKERASRRLGMNSGTIQLPAGTDERELLSQIDRLNNDPACHGILVQLPLPAHINEKKVLMHIRPEKDVDCFHPQNVGKLVAGDPYVLPCTPAGILEMLKFYKIQTAGRHAVIAGRSNIVGKPMANLLVQKNDTANCTVTVVHSRTPDIAAFSRSADILIAAIGKPRFFKADMIKEGAVVIDVGINRIGADNEKGYRLVGDVDFDDVLPKVSMITPVPGGVGPMTITMLLFNTVTVARHTN